MKKLLVVVVLLLIAIGGWYGFRRPDLQKRKEGEVAQAVFPVARGALTISVTEAGTIKARDQVIIKSEVEGRTTILFLVPEGNHVKQGDLLVELDVSSLEDRKIDQEIQVQNAEAAFIGSRENLEVVKNQAQSDVDKAELAFEFAKEDLTKYLEGDYPNQLKEYEAKITLSEEEVQRSNEKLTWSKVLFDEKYLSQSELQADQLAAKKAALDLELALNNQKLLKDYTYHRKLAELRSDVRQAEMALERIKRKASADIVQAEAALRAKDSEFRRQQGKLVKIKEQIGKARILAPTDGLVVYATSARANWRGNAEPLDEGQEVRERQELIYLPTTSKFMAEVKVHESSLEKISRDLAVRISVDALPGKTFTGGVVNIAPLPDAQSIFMNPDLKIYKTDILIDGNGDSLRTGMSCQAEIVVAHYADAMYIPVQSVVRVQGQTTAFVLKGGEVQPRKVKIGLDNNRMVHVLEGLTLGENVLLAPPLGETGTGEGRSTASGAVKRPAGSTKPAAGTSAPENGTKPKAPPTPGAAPGNGEAEGANRSEGARTMTPEQREKLRERLEKMSPEEREAMRSRREQARSRRSNGVQGGEQP
jgi:HlyD family secretion protein